MVEGRSATRAASSTGPLRVLFVDNSSTFGGAIISLGHLVSSLDRSRVHPTVVSAQPEARLRELFPAGDAIHMPMWVPWENGRLPSWMKRVPGARSAKGGWDLVTKRLGTARRLANVGRRVGADLVHLNNVIEAQMDGAFAARLLGVPCVAHARGFQKPSRTARLYARMPALHVAISSAIADDLRRLGVEADRIRIIHNGVDPSAFAAPADPAATRRSLGLPVEAPLFGFFGRIVPWKGVLEFVEAAGVVLRELPEARAVVVGDESDGSEAYLRSVQERVRELGIGDRLVFTGYRAEIADLMAATDVVVHTSIDPEPFGLVVAEAMAAGRPVVAADRGGPPDIVQAGVTGEVVDPTDSRALANAILELLRDPARARRMGEAGRARVRQRFSKEAVARSVESLYAELRT